MKRPAQLYKPSPRKLPTVLAEPSYPQHDDVVPVARNGNIRFRRKQFYLSTALAYQYVGVREEDDGRWLVTFMNLDLGHLSRSGFAPL